MFIRSSLKRWAIGLIALTVTTTVLLQIGAVKSAYASYGNTYPWGGALCAWTGNLDGPCANYDWGYTSCPPGDGFCSSTSQINGYYQLDQFGYGFRNCTSYVAWQIKQVFGITLPPNWGDGKDWNDHALNAGYADDPLSLPHVGDIAQWDPTNQNTWGHVAYVYAVNNGVASYAEYNHASDGNYLDTQTSAVGSQGAPTHYIHIKKFSTHTTPAVVRNDGFGNLEWLERNENSLGTNDVPTFIYGSSSTDTPLTGDWNYDGHTSPGVVRNDGAGNWQWLESNFNSNGANDVPAFTYGLTTDIPITGDWNGDGFTTPGVVRNEGGQWHFLLRNENTGGPADVDVTYGDQTTDTPVVGDWDGNGTTTVGVVRDNGAGLWDWLLRNSNTNGTNDVPAFTYGTVSTDKVVTGDWDADGHTTPGVVRNDGSGNLEWLETNYNSSGTNDVPAFPYGTYGTDAALTGDWDDN